MGVYRRAYTKNGVKRISRFWYCRDPFTGLEKSLHVTEKAVAEMLYGDLRRASELRRAGVFVPIQAHNADPTKLVARYLAELRSLNRSDGYVKILASRLGYFTKPEHTRSLKELTPTRIKELLTARVAEARLCPKTRNFYLDALGCFFEWLKREDLWRDNPVDQIERAVVAGNQRDRWALTVEQLSLLIGRAPLWRAAAYVLAGTTGLRRGELLQLLETDLDLTAGTLRVRAPTAKDRQDDVLPLNAWAVDVVGRYLAAYPPERPIGQRGPHVRARGPRLFTSIPEVATLQRDMRAVGLEPVNAAGEHFDFHALRATFITILAREDVPLALAQRLARHSDPRLTSRIYTKLTLHDGRRAVNRIRPPGAGKGAGEPGQGAG